MTPPVSNPFRGRSPLSRPEGYKQIALDIEGRLVEFKSRWEGNSLAVIVLTSEFTMRSTKLCYEGPREDFIHAVSRAMTRGSVAPELPGLIRESLVAVTDNFTTTRQSEGGDA